MRKKYNYDSYIGRKIQKILILSIIRGERQTKAKCLCKCKRIFEANFIDIIRKHTKSCGCHKPIYTKDRREKQSRLCSFINKKYKTGIKQTIEHRKKNSLALKKARRTYSPIWNKGRSAKTCPIMKRIGKKLSRIMKGRPAPWVKNNGRRKFWYYNKKKRLRMRSYWEVKYAKYLDSKNIKWLYEAFCFVGKDFSYCPDFYLIKEKKFIEIKGAEYNLDKKKVKSLINFGARIEVLFGDDLKKLGVLKQSTWTGRRTKNAVV